MKTKKVKVVEATQDHINSMSGNLRKSDELECKAALGVSASEAMQFAFDSSLMCWVGLYEGVPFNAFGVVANSTLNYKGAPWMLGTNVCKEVGKGILILSKGYISQMLAPFNMLENWVDERNKVSIKWLKWCGFNIEDAEAYGVEKRPFHRFWIKKGDYYV